MSLALAIDELLTNPRYARFAQWAYENTPVDVRDQFDAAGAHATYITDVVGVAMGADPRDGGWAPSAQFPDWMRLGAFDAIALFLSGQHDTCIHNPQPDRAQPIVAAAWKPGMVTCPQCVILLNCKPESVADRTCDACGHVCEGPDVDDGIHPGVTRVGVLVYQYGVCRRCKDGLAELVRP